MAADQMDDYKVQSSLWRNSEGTDHFGNSMWDDDFVVGKH